MNRFLRLLLPPLTAGLCGAGTTLLIALGIAHYAPPPDSWEFRNEHTRKFALGYEEYFQQRPDTERMAILSGTAVGVHVLDLNYYDADDFNTSLHPPRLRRRLVTEVGWPVPALRTDALKVGRRFISDSSEMHGPYVGDGVWAMLPSGFIFNSLFFGAPWLALLVAFPPTRRRAAAPAVLLCIAASLWLSVGLAWGTYSLHDRSILTHYIQDPAEFEAMVGRIIRPADRSAWNAFEGHITQSLGSRIERYHFGWTSINDEGVAGYETVALRRFRHDIGLPFPSFTSERDGVSGPVAGTAAELFRFDVHWPGLVANWLGCAALLVGLISLPPWMRTRRRLRRNCCPACGYPIGQSAVCTECGERLPKSPASAGGSVRLPNRSARSPGKAGAQ